MHRAFVADIAICPVARQRMQSVSEVEAICGRGLTGDRYAEGKGSYNPGAPGKRQVTLINAEFVAKSDFSFLETRRNILTSGVELMWLIGREFEIGTARFRGVKYCDPCLVPSALAKKKLRFNEIFHDRGGLIAEVIRDGMIWIGASIIPPPKGY